VRGCFNDSADDGNTSAPRADPSGFKPSSEANAF
jgi:hypothetical protein